MITRKAIRVGSVFLLGAIVGCAEVAIQKVPSPSQYIEWTDEMQRRADEMVGARFYLPRPFVNVHTSFPISTDIYLAEGKVSPDGKYVHINNIKTESELKASVASDFINSDIPLKNIRATQAGKNDHIPTPQSDEVKEGDTASSSTPTPATSDSGSSPKSDSTVPPRVAEIRSGVTEQKVTNDNAAYAYQPMRGNIDIAYLPDFDEQYVVDTTSGLGTAKFAMNLGQGWSLQGFDSIADNSALNKRIFDLIDTSVKLAKAAASTAAGVPPGIPIAAADEVVMSEGKPGELPHAITVPGTPVTLKIVVVHYAAKGIYPVIKPRELQERTLVDGKYFMVFDLFRLIPRVTPGSRLDPLAINRAQEAIDNETGRFTVPRYPYQYLSLNTFRYMAIELLTPANSPFGTLYHETGTTGSTTPPPLPSQTTPKPPAPLGESRTAAKLEAYAKEINQSLNVPLGGGDFGVLDASVDANGALPVLAIKLVIIKQPKSPIDNSALEDFFAKQLLEYGLNRTEYKLIITTTSIPGPTTQEDEAISPTNPLSLSKTDVETIQIALCMKGKEVDGTWGPTSTAALKTYQETTNTSKKDGEITEELARDLKSQTPAQILSRCDPENVDQFTAFASSIRGKSFAVGDITYTIRSAVANPTDGTVLVEFDANATGTEVEQKTITKALLDALAPKPTTLTEANIKYKTP